MPSWMRVKIRLSWLGWGGGRRVMMVSRGTVCRKVRNSLSNLDINWGCRKGIYRRSYWNSSRSRNVAWRQQCLTNWRWRAPPLLWIVTWLARKVRRCDWEWPLSWPHLISCRQISLWTLPGLINEGILAFPRQMGQWGLTDSWRCIISASSGSRLCHLGTTRFPSYQSETFLAYSALASSYLGSGHSWVIFEGNGHMIWYGDIS